MMRRALLLVPCVLALAATALVPATGAGQPGQRRVSGTWTYAGAPAEGAEIVASAVEPVLQMMPPDLAPIARERIAESTWLPTRIRIAARPGHVQVALNGVEQRTFAGPAGSPIQVPLRHGYAQLVQSLRPDGSLQQDFTAMDGTQQNLFIPGPNGTMLLDVTLRSQHFPNDIHFQLTYRRGR